MAIVDEVDVWKIALDAAVNDDVLSAGERERMARFHFQRDRLRYAASHAALRQILARYVGGHPAALEFTVGANGKPALKVNPLGMQFNLSHSGDLAMVAVARERNVGVDVERIRSEIGALEIARRFFDPAEAEAVADGGPSTFFELWTRKEALVKARGLTLAPGLRVTEAAGYTVQAVDAPAGYTAAVAAEGTGWTVVAFEFSDKTSSR